MGERMREGEGQPPLPPRPSLSARALRERYAIQRPIDENADREAWQVAAAADVVPQTEDDDQV